MSDLTYLDYTGDAAHMQQYREYQQKYASKLRESDRVTLDLIRERLPSGTGKLIDLGCSTGNMLRHLRHALPQLQLCGGDLVGSIIEENRAAKDLAGIEFRELDMLSYAFGPEFDIVLTNAALMFFDDAQFERSIVQAARALKPGGHLVTFDLFSQYDQEITVVERSHLHPQGLKFSFRSHRVVGAALDKAGLVDPRFRFFSMPFDLPKPSEAKDVTSYTEQTTDGRRLSFRGSLFQPWCHLTARKPA
jgi:SAM-dependent methyltransferase